jgi:hypothetical protein
LIGSFRVLRKVRDGGIDFFGLGPSCLLGAWILCIGKVLSVGHFNVLLCGLVALSVLG